MSTTDGNKPNESNGNGSPNEPRRVSIEIGEYAPADAYYGLKNTAHQNPRRQSTFSTVRICGIYCVMRVVADSRSRTTLLHESARTRCPNCQLAVVAMVSCLYTATLTTCSPTTDESTLGQLKFLINVDSTLENLQKQEDTDNNFQITIEDNGPKVAPTRSIPAPTTEVNIIFRSSPSEPSLPMASDAMISAAHTCSPISSRNCHWPRRPVVI